MGSAGVASAGALAEVTDIPDPYGGDAADFNYVLDLLEAAAPAIIARLGSPRPA